MRIVLSVQLEVNGRAKVIQIDSLTRGDFTTGRNHILQEYFEPMSELVMAAYEELTAEENPLLREAMDEREEIRQRLAKIGMH